MILAAIGLGELLWTLLVLLFMVSYFMMLFSIVVDLFRDHGTNGVTKALWAIALLVVPFITMIIYLIARGDGMAERQYRAAATSEAEVRAYIADAAGSATPADQIRAAKALLDEGAIDQAEFEQLKAKALA